MTEVIKKLYTINMKTKKKVVKKTAKKIMPRAYATAMFRGAMK